jgi:glycosyltransferase involved in cell wall biosynthesis
MKALVVLAQPPAPQGGAAGRCAWALLRGVQAHGVEVRAIAARRPQSPTQEAPQVPWLEVVDVEPYGPSLRDRITRLRRPRSELAHAFADHVAAAAAGVDVVHLDEWESSWCRVPGLPSLLRADYLIEEDRSPGAPWSRGFVMYYEELRAERLAVQRHEELVANSPQVAGLLRRLAPRTPVSVVPLALEPDEYRRAPLDGSPRVGLIGTMSWPPTQAAVQALLEESWPAVRRAVPAAELWIAGRGSEQLAAGDGVVPVGPVASSAEFLEQLSLLLFPVPRGSGMKVKVLEAMASGVPVVTTPSGAEGIAPNDGVVVTRSETELVEAATRILCDPGERAARGEAAHICFQANYTPEAAAKPLVAAYARLAETGVKAGAQRANSSA